MTNFINVIFEWHYIESSNLKFNERNTTYIIEKFKETGQYVALEDFIVIIRNTLGCDIDLIYEKFVEAHSSDPYKMFDIWEYMQEDNHIPSQQLILKMMTIIQEEGLTVPDSMKSESKKL